MHAHKQAGRNHWLKFHSEAFIFPPFSLDIPDWLESYPTYVSPQALWPAVGRLERMGPISRKSR